MTHPVSRPSMVDGALAQKIRDQTRESALAGHDYETYAAAIRRIKAEHDSIRPEESAP